MKILGKHILILGGFYFIISFLLDLGQGYSFNILEAIVACCFIVMFLCLCFKRKFLVFETFQIVFYCSGMVAFFSMDANSNVQHFKKAFPLKLFILLVFTANEEFIPFSFCIKKNNSGDCASGKTHADRRRFSTAEKKM